MLGLSFLVVLAVLAVALALKNTYEPAGPTFQARDYTTWQAKKAGNSKRGEINVKFTADDGSDDYVTITRLDLVGNSYDRGYAHGKLMSRGKFLFLFFLLRFL
jgi:hypothetical protein